MLSEAPVDAPQPVPVEGAHVVLTPPAARGVWRAATWGVERGIDLAAAAALAVGLSTTWARTSVDSAGLRLTCFDDCCRTQCRAPADDKLAGMFARLVVVPPWLVARLLLIGVMVRG